ncbi:MAG TPA: glycoside hydrolase family protein [Burkholderiales bacterium]|nr:glycoside hydrolase family protein [Burkholderiales bacterium]
MSDWAEAAVPLVAEFEGCAKLGKDGLVYPYLDKLAKPPVWTRAYGRTYGISKDSPPISKDEAKLELQEGLARYAAECVKLAPELANRPECLAAVASWAWNCGVGAFRVSRLRRAINEGRWRDASEFIRRPRTAGGVELRGLARRRDTEALLFAKGVVEAGGAD